VFAAYFSGVMSRLMLVLAPASAILSGVGMSSIVTRAVLAIYGSREENRDKTEVTMDVTVTTQASKPESMESAMIGKPSKKSMQGSSSSSSQPTAAAAMNRTTPKFYLSREAGFVAIIVVGYGLFKYIQHCLYMANYAYSSPSVVLQVSSGAFWDDFREAYYWLHQNTDPNDKVLSWWDYGYQLNGMSNRTTIVDNNTWNNSHIATVGRALNSPEKKAHTICRKLDAKYVLILFGGMVGYSSDDLNKFLWPVRISGSVDPRVKEGDYLASNGQYITEESKAGPALLQSIMYRLSYYRFNEIRNHQMGAVDMVRQHRAPSKKIKLRYFEEAYTTEHWLVRIYRVKDVENRGFV
jgi:dolichyl-diphosphooligosaccharide---protein glycosyltransferase